MKVVTEIDFEDLMDKADSSGYDFLEIVDSLDLKDELMNILNSQYIDFPELSEVLFEIDENSEELMNKLGLVNIESALDKLKEIYKQTDIAISRCDSENEWLISVLDNLLYAIDNLEADSYSGFVAKDNLFNFLDEGRKKVETIGRLNDQENENFVLLNSIRDELKLVLKEVENLLR